MVTDAVHGMSGWRDGELFIYNGRWGTLGWYRLKDYQVLKVILTGKPDFRVMPRSFYEGNSGFLGEPASSSFDRLISAPPRPVRQSYRSHSWSSSYF